MSSRDQWVESGGHTWRAGTDGLPLESPDGRDWVLWHRANAKTFSAAVPSPDLRRHPHHTNRMVRIGSEYPDRLNQHVRRYVSSVDGHVWCESRVEESCLIELDYSGALSCIAAQPMRFLFNDDAKPTRHDADFFAVMTTGEQVVINVKRLDKLRDEAVKEQFEQVDRVCATVGWEHRIMTESDPVRLANLDFLSAAAQAHNHPPPETRRQILDVFADGMTLEAARSRVNRKHPAQAMPYIRHMAWNRLLHFDLSTPLNADTTFYSAVQTRPEDVTCCAA